MKSLDTGLGVPNKNKLVHDGSHGVVSKGGMERDDEKVCCRIGRAIAHGVGTDSNAYLR